MHVTIAALREAGKIGKVKAVLLSATSFAISALRKGEVQAVVAEPLESIGERSIEAAYEDANGKKLPKEERGLAHASEDLLQASARCQPIAKPCLSIGGQCE